MDAVAVFLCKQHAVPEWLNWISATVYVLLFLMCALGAWNAVRLRHFPIPPSVVAWQLATFWVLGATLSVHLLRHEVCTWP